VIYVQIEVCMVVIIKSFTLHSLLWCITTFKQPFH